MGAAEPKVFDVEDAMHRVGGDRSLYRELVDIFLGDCPKSLSELQDAVSSSSLKGAEEFAHSIKSALGNLGAMRAYTVAQRLEAAARQGRGQDLAPELERLKVEVEQYRHEVQGFLAASP